MEGRLENIILELERKDEQGNYINNSSVHRNLRSKLTNIYGSLDSDYLKKIESMLMVLRIQTYIKNY